jgi:hypothetical protein
VGSVRLKLTLLHWQGTLVVAWRTEEKSRIIFNKNLEMLQDAIDVGRDLKELREVIGRAVSDAYRILKVAISHHPYFREVGGFCGQTVEDVCRGRDDLTNVQMLWCASTMPSLLTGNDPEKVECVKFCSYSHGATKLN